MADPADKTGEQLTLEIAEKTRSRIIASSSLNFQIELMEHVGEEDIPKLILISEHLVEEFTEDVRLTKTSIARRKSNLPGEHAQQVCVWQVPNKIHAISMPYPCHTHTVPYY